MVLILSRQSGIRKITSQGAGGERERERETERERTRERERERAGVVGISGGSSVEQEETIG